MSPEEYRKKRLAGENMEEGIRETSFFEVPGAYEIKKSVIDKLRGSKVPGAGIAADGIDLLVPEEINPAAMMAKAGKLKGLGMAAMAVGKENSAVSKADRAMGKIEGGFDYKKLNAPKPNESGHTLSYGSDHPWNSKVTDTIHDAAAAAPVKKTKEELIKAAQIKNRALKK